MRFLAASAALASSCLLSACVGSSAPTKASTPARAEPAPTAAAPEKDKRKLPAREELPLVLRETLSSSMDRHGEELVYLLSSVVLLHYSEAEELAELIASEPKLGRPLPDDTDSLNALLPEGFFVHQDALTERAKALAAAARAKDDARLVKAFGALAETCVGCHSAYLHDELETIEH